MDTVSLGGSMSVDRQIRGTPLQVDTFAGKFCVVRCIHDQGGKVWMHNEEENAHEPVVQARSRGAPQEPVCGVCDGEHGKVYGGIQKAGV